MAKHHFWAALFLTFLAASIPWACAQEDDVMVDDNAFGETNDVGSNNYEKQSVSVAYNNDTELPLLGILNGTVTELDTLAPTITLNKTKAELNCSSGFMSIKLNFGQPFFGIVYADYDRNSACKIVGNGKNEETIQLPLKGCGTLQSPARVFTNNIVVRFHHGLEIDGDEVITVVCRYPPPIVIAPKAEKIQTPVLAPVPSLQPLREFEILLIICAIIFLALMLLGIGCSYYCLKKRNIKVIRRRPTSTLGSDVTKISEPISMFNGLKIPRPVTEPASGSEEVEESVRTDFASEVASVESEEEYTSAYSDKLCVLAEGAVAARLHEPPVPRFDIDMIVKDRRDLVTPVMSSASSETGTILNAQEQYLTTILERTETNTLETLERIRRAKARQVEAQIPVHARINIRQKAMSDASGTDVDTTSEYSHATELYSEQEIEVESRPMRNFAIISEETRAEMVAAGSGEDRSQGGSVLVADHAGRSSSAIVEHHSHHQEHHVSTASTAANRDVRASSARDVSNFDVLFRIVTVSDNFVAGGDSADEISSIFTSDERDAIRRALERDHRLQNELRTTFHRHEFRNLMTTHTDLQRTVEPHKWDVLIRVLEDPRSDFALAVATDADSASNYSGMAGGETNTAFFLDRRGASAYTSGGASSFVSSAADRSATEIFEEHHYTQQQQQKEFSSSTMRTTTEERRQQQSSWFQ